MSNDDETNEVKFEGQVKGHIAPIETFYHGYRSRSRFGTPPSKVPESQL